MINLDNLAEIKKLDQGNALESISQFPAQCEQAFEEAKKITFPSDFQNAKNIVIAGMGGSALAARIVKSFFLTQLTKPVELVTSYELPYYVSDNSLVFLSSFSGTTEETLTIGNQAKKRGAKITGITSGGKLADFFKISSYPAYIFTPKYNPSKQPRLGQGYMVTGTIVMLSQLGLFDLAFEEIVEATQKLYHFDSKNLAKKVAQKCHGRYPVLFSGDIYEGALHAVRNSFNETSKQFAAYFSIPELNHHLMEGFSFPKDNSKKLLVIIFESLLYSPKIGQRIEITKDVLSKNNIDYLSYRLKSETTLSQMLEILQFGGYLTFYLAIVNGVDPSKIPWVDYFKKRLI